MSSMKSFNTTVAEEKKFFSMKHWILFHLMSAVMPSCFLKNKMLNLNKMPLFFVHLASFHVFWTSLMVFFKLFLCVFCKALRISFFLRFIVLRFFFKSFEMIFWSFARKIFWNFFLIWFAWLWTFLHWSLNFNIILVSVRDLNVELMIVV